MERLWHYQRDPDGITTRLGMVEAIKEGFLEEVIFDRVIGRMIQLVVRR